MKGGHNCKELGVGTIEQMIVTGRFIKQAATG